MFGKLAGIALIAALVWHPEDIENVFSLNGHNPNSSAVQMDNDTFSANNPIYGSFFAK